MANRIQMGSIWMDCSIQSPCFRFEPEEHFPFDSPANIEIRDSTSSPSDIIWVVVNNKLIAARPVMHTVSFADLQELNLVHGYEVSIDGQWYQIRMLMDLDEWLLALEAVGEDDHIWHWEQCQSFLQQPSGNDSGFSVQIRVDWISQTWSCGLTAVSRLAGGQCWNSPGNLISRSWRLDRSCSAGAGRAW